MKCRKNTSGQVGVAQENITMRLLSANNVLIIPFRHINFSLRNAPHGPYNVKP